MCRQRVRRGIPGRARRVSDRFEELRRPERTSLVPLSGLVTRGFESSPAAPKAAASMLHLPSFGWISSKPSEVLPLCWVAPPLASRTKWSCFFWPAVGFQSSQWRTKSSS